MPLTPRNILVEIATKVDRRRKHVIVIAYHDLTKLGQIQGQLVGANLPLFGGGTDIQARKQILVVLDQIENRRFHPIVVSPGIRTDLGIAVGGQAVSALLGGLTDTSPLPRGDDTGAHGCTRLVQPLYSAKRLPSGGVFGGQIENLIAPALAKAPHRRIQGRYGFANARGCFGEKGLSRPHISPAFQNHLPLGAPHLVIGEHRVFRDPAHRGFPLDHILGAREHHAEERRIRPA